MTSPSPPTRGFVDELVAELRRDGVAEDGGEFTIDRETARRKLDDFQLADRDRYLLEWVQAAVCKGATEIDIDVDADDVVVTFGGEPFGAADFDLLYHALFSAVDDPAARARQQVALGIGAVLAKSPRYVHVISGPRDAQVELWVEPGKPERFGPVPEPVTLREGYTTRISVKLPVSGAVLSRKLTDLVGKLPEVRALDDCGYSRIQLRVNGERLWSRVPLGDELVIAVGDRADAGTAATGWRGEVGFYEFERDGCLHLVKDGVRIEKVELPGLPSVTAVVEGAALRKDLSQTRIVRDSAYEAALALVWEGVLRGVERLAEAAERGEPVKRSRRYPLEVLQVLAVGRLQRKHLEDSAPSGDAGPESRVDARLARAKMWVAFAAGEDSARRASLRELYERAAGGAPIVAILSSNGRDAAQAAQDAEGLCVLAENVSSFDLLPRLIPAVEQVMPDGYGSGDRGPPRPKDAPDDDWIGLEALGWTPTERRAALGRLPFVVSAWPSWLGSRAAFLRGAPGGYLTPPDPPERGLALVRWIAGQRNPVPRDRWALPHQVISHLRPYLSSENAYLLHDATLERWGLVAPIDSTEEVGLVLSCRYDGSRLAAADVVIWRDGALPHERPLGLLDCAQTLPDGSGQVIRLEYRPGLDLPDPGRGLAVALGHVLAVASGDAPSGPSEGDAPPAGESWDLPLHDRVTTDYTAWNFRSEAVGLWVRALAFWTVRLGLVGVAALPGLSWWQRMLPLVAMGLLSLRAASRVLIRPRFPRLRGRRLGYSPDLVLRLCADGERLYLAPFPNLHIELSAPFTVEVAVGAPWPDVESTPPHAVVTLRQDVGLRLEVVVPLDSETRTTGVPQRRSAAPTLSRQDFARLWERLRQRGAAHGLDLPADPLSPLLASGADRPRPTESSQSSQEKT